MILRKLALHHFLTYSGDQHLELPASDEGSSLTIIVGPNNSGKTSLIRALKFWFYGEQGVPKKADLPLYLNNKAKSETEIGRSLEGWVEVTFEHETNRGKETTCLGRTLTATRTGADRWEFRSVSLRELLPGARQEHAGETEADWQHPLWALIPRTCLISSALRVSRSIGSSSGDVSSIRQPLRLFLC